MASLKTFVGDIFVKSSGGNIISLHWGANVKNKTSSLEEEANTQLNEYFTGKRRTFSLPLQLGGTTFQKRVWSRVAKIPYGKTISYADIASKLNTSPRAVGGAVGANPVPIVIPCHRVVGKNSALVGFSAGEGIATKQLLLEHEQKVIWDDINA